MEAITLEYEPLTWPYNNRGHSHAMQGAYVQAIKDYNRAIAFDPEDARAYFGRGLAYSSNPSNQRG
jgi:Flp pilus assembly protein TadD